MKKLLCTTIFVVTFFICSAVSAAAVVNDTVRVGLRYGSSAMFSANLENAEGEGYAFGWFDDQRAFQEVGRTDHTAISMTAAGDIYMTENGTYSREMPSGAFRHMGPWHVQLHGFGSFKEAERAARDHGGWPAWISGEYVVRVGCYDSRQEAQEAAQSLGEGGAVPEKSSNTGVVVTATRTTDILFEFDYQGIEALAVQPDGWGAEPITWFKGYRYRGGFEYPRVTGGNLNVINVVDLEDYVKGVIPHEMSGEWPLAALEAQAVCARTYACRTTKHFSAYAFDVCASTDCQVYNGVSTSTARSDAAVDNTAGECVYYNGQLAETVYHASDGGATEDAANVWGSDVPYLRGKQDPYEAQTTIPNYAYTVTYTPEELTWVLQNSGYSIGTVEDVYVEEYTPLGNVHKVTFVDRSGQRLSVKGEACRMAFYSTTYNKNVRSLRFTINGDTSGIGSPASGGGYCVNGPENRLDSLSGVSVISGNGEVGILEREDLSIITASGTSPLSGGKKGRERTVSHGDFVITGTGNGHNVGMSQYGAKAMAEQGYRYQDILSFYFTDITIE